MFTEARQLHPGSGKDTWLATHRAELPVISLDEMRAELGIEPNENQGEVAQLARERCREMLRSRTSFAFNATNLLRQTRQRWINLFADYDARIEMVYVEPVVGPSASITQWAKGGKSGCRRNLMAEIGRSWRRLECRR